MHTILNHPSLSLRDWSGPQSLFLAAPHLSLLFSTFLEYGHTWAKSGWLPFRNSAETDKRNVHASWELWSSWNTAKKRWILLVYDKSVGWRFVVDDESPVITRVLKLQVVTLIVICSRFWGTLQEVSYALSQQVAGRTSKTLCVLGRLGGPPSRFFITPRWVVPFFQHNRTC